MEVLERKENLEGDPKVVRVPQLRLEVQTLVQQCSWTDFDWEQLIVLDITVDEFEPFGVAVQ